MAGHGIQKLRDPDKTAQGFEFMGLRPGRQHALAAGAVETAAGLGAVLGLFTPAASAATTGTMTVAIAKVHGKNGPWITKGGYEYNATLMATAFALAAAGPGRAALDGSIVRRRTGLGWGVAQLVAGSVAGLAVVEAARRRAARSDAKFSPPVAEVRGEAEAINVEGQGGATGLTTPDRAAAERS